MNDMQYIIATDRVRVRVAIDQLNDIVVPSNPCIPNDEFFEVRRTLKKWEDVMFNTLNCNDWSGEKPK